MLLNVKLFCVYVLDVCFLEKKTTICCPLGTILLFLDKEIENIFRARLSTMLPLKFVINMRTEQW